jgi:hypothetical protein
VLERRLARAGAKKGGGRSRGHRTDAEDSASGEAGAPDGS